MTVSPTYCLFSKINSKIMNSIFQGQQHFTLGNYNESVTRKISLNLGDSSQLVLKRGFDLFFSVLALVFIGFWLFPIIALLIKLTSEGPVVFKQLRHGQNNIPFYCFKFRTMRINDDADTKQATKNDPRITKVGSFLRRTSLDELPQIMNVIMGEMSIVGPRPHAVPMNYRFSKGIENFMLRHAVKPGITGLAQSKGFRGEARDFYDIHSRSKLDLFYIKNWSLFLDMKITVWTVCSMLLANKNAY